MSEERQAYGVMGRFPGPEELVAAARRCRDLDLRVEAYAPFPVAGLSEALALGASRVSPWALAGALFGGLLAFFVQSYSAVIDYPINVGGRPDFSWPAFLPAIVILTIFWGAMGATLGMLVLNRLPRLYHPVFNATEFAAASRDGYFLVIRPDQSGFDADAARARLLELGARTAEEVPA